MRENCQKFIGPSYRNHPVDKMWSTPSGNWLAYCMLVCLQNECNCSFCRISSPPRWHHLTSPSKKPGRFKRDGFIGRVFSISRMWDGHSLVAPVKVAPLHKQRNISVGSREPKVCRHTQDIYGEMGKGTFPRLFAFNISHSKPPRSLLASSFKCHEISLIPSMVGSCILGTK